MKYRLKSYSLPIDDIIRIIIDKIDLTSIDLATTITVILIRIPEIYALFARNYTIDPRSIHRRNKKLKRLDSILGTLISFLKRPKTLVILIDALLLYIYNI